MATRDNADLEALVRAAQAGDVDALTRLLQNGLYIINTIAEARVPEADVADVLQEIRLAVWEALPKLDEPGAATAWLRKIATWEIANHWRRGDGAASTEPIPDDLQDAETAFEEIEGWAVVEELLAGLPTRHQVVLVLRGIEELPFAEVGRQMEITEQAARQLFQRAKLKVLSRTSHFDPNPPA